MMSPRIFSCVVLLLALSCADGTASLDELALAKQPHEESFARFETWAERTDSSLASELAPRALSDSIFSPLRLQSAVLFAMVERRGERERAMAFPRSGRLKGDLRWTKLLRAGRAPLEVIVAERCPISVPSHFRDGAGEGPCVLLASEKRWGLAETRRVTVAFRRDGPPE